MYIFIYYSFLSYLLFLYILYIFFIHFSYIYMYMYIYIYIYIYIERERQRERERVRIIFFRSDPRKFREKFQQLQAMGKRSKLPLGFGAKMLCKCRNIVYSITLFGVRYKRFVELEV